MTGQGSTEGKGRVFSSFCRKRVIGPQISRMVPGGRQDVFLTPPALSVSSAVKNRLGNADGLFSSFRRNGENEPRMTRISRMAQGRDRGDFCIPSALSAVESRLGDSDGLFSSFRRNGENEPRMTRISRMVQGDRGGWRYVATVLLGGGRSTENGTRSGFVHFVSPKSELLRCRPGRLAVRRACQSRRDRLLKGGRSPENGTRANGTRPRSVHFVSLTQPFSPLNRRFLRRRAGGRRSFLRHLRLAQFSRRSASLFPD